ncbi:MAG: transcriptional regulator GcvA [Porticoccaceae bacterium]|nr:transcriptional regulator GcvA [Porticoccaceae bacterium]
MSRKLPPLNALKAFEAAARRLSFTAAADELYVTHGAISQHIRVLEDYFQQPLFVRSHGRVSLNEAGKELLPVMTDALDSMTKVSAHLSKNRDIVTIVVNLTATFASQWLIPRLGNFEFQHPNIRVRISPSNTFLAVLGTEHDIAIRWGAESISNSEVEKLLYVDTFCACAPSLIEGKSPLRIPADLSRHQLIHDDQGQAWQAILNDLNLNKLDQPPGLFYEDSGLALQVAVDGKGVIAAGSILAARDLAAGRLVLPFDHIIRQRNSYNIYYPKASQNLLEIQTFRDWLHQEAAIFERETFDYHQYLVF